MAIFHQIAIRAIRRSSGKRGVLLAQSVRPEPIDENTMPYRKPPADHRHV